MKLYNSLTQTKQDFHPLHEKTIKLYVCGITPYDTTHLGHASVYVFFDTLSRYFQFQGYEVEYTQNVTDIDDDILKRAKRDNQDWIELGDFWTNKFLKDIQDIHIQLPTQYIKATHSIDEIIRLVKTLMDKEFAYEKDGIVYFDVQKWKNYGQLSRYSQEEMIELSRERGANPDDANKKHPLDFIVWQKSLEGEPFWESPWGKGRPGWHIECSAMVRKTLGDQIDIHGGGFDLIYPHHESEIAQSEAATGAHPYVNTWMHVAMLRYQGEKMSKSLGNLILVSDLLQHHSANAIRLLLLSHHYRESWEYTEDEMKKAQRIADQIERALNQQSKVATTNKTVEQYEKDFFAALDDDMDTPKAVQVLTEVSEEILRSEKNGSLQPTLKRLAPILGIY